ncbi:WD40-repeat-containing domain protein [Crucibulum laeve]|uniref:WD40-repeat-containing domain protein n=1 Tax=Crucibulum laeve TaxID=68775 RepID=A0A5C3M682_9AGAR|nr:WD40-repeat-containing domain protein [Crucibulum laeve]
MSVYPHSHLFVGPSETVVISGPHIQVLSTTTGDILHSTVNFEDEKRGAVIESGPVRCAAVDKSNKYLITTAEDKMLKLWEIGGLKLLSERELPKKPTGLAFRADSQKLLTSDKFGDIFSYPFTYVPLTVKQKRDALSSHENPSSGQLILGHASPLNAFLLTSDEKYIVTADRDEHIRVSWYPQGYNIEMYCLGHLKFVSAIHIPHLDPSMLISGGGDPVLKIWDWMAGDLKHEVNVLDTIDPYMAVRALKRKRGEGEEGEEGEGKKRKKGKGKDKAKEETPDTGTPVAEGSEAAAEEKTEEAAKGEPSEPEKILVIHKIDSLDAEGCLWIVFSAVGTTALFTFPFKAGVTSSDIRAFDFGLPVIDFSITGDGEIWVNLDAQWKSTDLATSEASTKAVRVMHFVSQELKEVSEKALVSALNTKSLLQATPEELKKLDLYGDLTSMPKYSDSEAAEATPEVAAGGEKAKSKKELGRLKNKTKVLAKMAVSAATGDARAGEDELEEPETKRTKSEHGDEAEVKKNEDVVMAES